MFASRLRVITILLLQICALGTASAGGNCSTAVSGLDPREVTQWFYAAEKKEAVTLVVHGLNVKPSKMNAIVSDLQGMNFDVLRVSLAGHRGSLAEFKQVTRRRWLDDFYKAYRSASERAKQLGVPLHLVAFSLGAAVAEDLMNLNLPTPVVFDRVVLFAPALTVHWYTNSIRLLRVLGQSAVIPSMNLPDYRANEGTSMAAYTALFDSIHKLRQSGYKRSNVPTLVFLDPGDELVSYRGTTALKQSFGLDRWEIIPITNKGSRLPKTYHHLIIDSDVVGSEQWRSMQRMIREHFARCRGQCPTATADARS